MAVSATILFRVSLSVRIESVLNKTITHTYGRDSGSGAVASHSGPWLSRRHYQQTPTVCTIGTEEYNSHLKNIEQYCSFMLNIILQICTIFIFSDVIYCVTTAYGFGHAGCYTVGGIGPNNVTGEVSKKNEFAHSNEKMGHPADGAI